MGFFVGRYYLGEILFSELVTVQITVEVVLIGCIILIRAPLFLFLSLFCIFFVYFPHYRLALISQGTVLSRFVGGPMFQKFRRETDPELGEVQKC